LDFAHRPPIFTILFLSRNVGDFIGDIFEFLIPDYVFIKQRWRVWKGRERERENDKNVTIDSRQFVRRKNFSFSYGFLSKLGFTCKSTSGEKAIEGKREACEKQNNKQNKQQKKSFAREWQISRGTLKMHGELHQKNGRI
jgi:hypothetical protein